MKEKVDPKDAVIVFTSGTTSSSKGVRLSHRALWIQALAKLQPPCEYSRQTRMLASTVPLFHVGGLSSTLAVLMAGGTWVSGEHSFDPKSVLQSLGSNNTLPVNTLVVVPAMLHSLMQNTSPTDSYESVQLILIGGQSASPDTVRRIASVFPNARLVQTYACTEAASSLTFLQLDPNEETTMTLPNGSSSGDCVGSAPPHLELVLVKKNSQGRVELVDSPFQVGIFATRGPHIMNGYWKRNQEINPIKHLQDGWYLTNDLGFRDKVGRYYFCGRTKDVIRTGGETVIASEVERVLKDHPCIIESAVFAVPDERFGEAVGAAIVGRDGDSLTLSQVREYCAQHGLAGYKKPRRVFWVDKLPRNSSGKVLKMKLMEQFCVRRPLKSML
jgi:acyl-CoA synthetase (AMP-forming)/AMP-acid ligase II